MQEDLPNAKIIYLNRYIIFSQQKFRQANTLETGLSHKIWNVWILCMYWESKIYSPQKSAQSYLSSWFLLSLPLPPHHHRHPSPTP